MPVYVVDKPLGVTSHDVVASVRRSLGTKRVGHAGTLDPLATGVLTILVGDATKLSPYLVGSDKSYLAWITFGASTATWDAEGPVVAEGDATRLAQGDVVAATRPFLALTEQRPPTFSAVKRGGRAAYRDARAGKEVPAMELRPAGYRSIEVLALGDRTSLPSTFAQEDGGTQWAPSADGRTFTLPDRLSPSTRALEWRTALIRTTVAAGTYVRALAHELGAALGVPAHLAGLVRTAAGPASLAAACPPSDVASAIPTPDDRALPFPVVHVDDDSATRLRHGQRLPRRLVAATGRVAFVDGDRRLVAIADVEPDRMQLLRTFPVS